MTLPDPNAPIVEVTGVTKRFPGVLALKDVSVAFRRGEVHAVVGENGAGKSTLMNVLAGELKPDSGEIKIDGRPIAITSPLVSQKLGIKVVYQELSLCPNLSAAENVMLPSAAARSPLSLVGRGEMRQAARKVLARLGSSGLDPATPVRKLSVAQAQLVEIARAISQQARVLVLDEPNSALSHRESENLFAIVRQLRDEGVTIIYISHHLNEVLGIADRITIMRDGRSIETMENVNLTEARLIAGMIGRDMGATPQHAVQPGAAADDRPVVLAVENLVSAPEIRRVSFQLRRGEILGIGGLPDSGKDELASALFGLKPRQARSRSTAALCRRNPPGMQSTAAWPSFPPIAAAPVRCSR